MLFCELSLVKGLKYHPLRFAILLPASTLGLHQVLPTCAQADKDLAARGHRPQYDSKFFKSFWGSSLGLGNSLTLTLSSVLDQGVKDTRRGSSATSGSFIFKGYFNTLFREEKQFRQKISEM